MGMIIGMIMGMIVPMEKIDGHNFSWARSYPWIQIMGMAIVPMNFFLKSPLDIDKYSAKKWPYYK